MNRALLFSAFGAVFALLALADGAAAGRAAGPPPGVPPEYLALGDSLAFGVGASDRSTTGYVPQVYAYLQAALDPGAADPARLGAIPDAFNRRFLQLRNLGVGGLGAPAGGETSSTMISGGQLAAALAELAARNGNAAPVDDVRVVTLDIGGNDMFPLLAMCSGGITPACASAVGAALGAFSANLGSILAQLRAAAGPDAGIAVMTYYNSLVNPACPFSALAPLANVVLEGEPALGIPAGLNDIIRGVAASQGAVVAETFGLLGPADVLPDCRHPDDSGHAAIAQAFMGSLG